MKDKHYTEYNKKQQYDILKKRSFDVLLSKSLRNLIALMFIQRYCSNYNKDTLLKLMGKYLNRYHRALEGIRILSITKKRIRLNMMDEYESVMNGNDSDKCKFNKMLVIFKVETEEELIYKYIDNNIDTNKKILNNK